MESDKYICIREERGDGSGSLCVVDVSTHTPMRLPAEHVSDAAIMHPKLKVVALRDSQNIQLWNLTSQQKVKEIRIREPVIFWKWVSDKTIGYVTANAVHHWDIDTDTPRKMFDRLPTVNGMPLNYRVDPSEKFCVLNCAAPSSATPGAPVVGQTQFFSVDKAASTFIEAHVSAFATFQFPDAPGPSTMFAFASQTPTEAKLTIMEVQRPPEKQQQTPTKQQNLVLVDNVPDFPIAMHISSRYGIIFIVTKNACIYLIDLETGTSIYKNKLNSMEAIFTAAPQEGGLITVNRAGQVLAVAVDDANIIPYLVNTQPGLALRLASRCNLTGAESLFIAQFNRVLGEGKIEDAAKLAAIAPGTVLRNPQTIERFSRIDAAAAGGKSPLLMYFKNLLDRGKLDKVESIELSRQVLSMNRKDFLQQWINDDKLDCSEELGDLISPADQQLAMQVYKKANASGKVLGGMVNAGQYADIIAFSRQSGQTNNLMEVMDRICSTNPKGAIDFAQLLLNQDGGPMLDLGAVMDIFLKWGQLPLLTPFMIEALRANRQDQAHLQTRLLEVNLTRAPPVADAILGSEMFTYYDRQLVANLCEQAQLYQRALEHHTQLNDIRRCLVNGCMTNLKQEWVVGYFQNLASNPEYALECLKDLLAHNLQGNLQVCINIAIKYHQSLGADKLIALFESFKCTQGLYYFLQQIVGSSESPEVHFKYIEAAADVGDLKEVERVTRVSNVYDPQRVKDLLKEKKLGDQRPLINVCDRFNMIEELTQYLYRNNMLKYIELYVTRVSPQKTPEVVGALLDLDCNEEWIGKLLQAVRQMVNVSTEELVAQVEKRNRLKLLLPWLEGRAAQGNTETATYNALAKIYVDINRDPETFLNTDTHYDHRVVGAYCEKRDPHFAYLAYKKGECDAELVAVTNKNQLFKQQARYLVQRQNQDLWAQVLNPENEYSRAVIDQVVSTALPETKNANQVAATVKAFMAANLPHELIELLEKIVLQPKGTLNEFSNNTKLQNLLFFSAIKAAPDRVMTYIDRLEFFDSTYAAGLCLESGLFEEAFAIRKKGKQYVEAITVLLDRMPRPSGMERAMEFAARVDQADVWSTLAFSQMNAGMMPESIASYIKAADPSMYKQVIQAAERANVYEELVNYLQMARSKQLKDAQIDTELIYAFAKSNRLAELEEFLTTPNFGEIQVVGDRTYDEGLYEAARRLYHSIGNYGRLAAAWVKLGFFQQAVDAAKKADSIRTWKEVNACCVDAGEFKLALQCGMPILSHADEIDELVFVYEKLGHFSELILLMEHAVTTLERPSNNLFTELAILYSKYDESKLMDHLQSHWETMTLPPVQRACENNLQWKESVFLQLHYGSHDQAIMTMIEHSTDCWSHPLFKETVAKVTTLDVLYKAITFYLLEHPLETNDLLNVLLSKVEHSAVVSLVRKLDKLAIVKPYLQIVQKCNVAAVNEALNELFVEEGDHEALRASVDGFEVFDQLALAHKLEKSELLEFRRISAHVFRKNKRFEKAVGILKKDRMYKDAMEVAAASSDRELAESLLTFFVEQKLPDCFAACLYTCYSCIRPDVALELGWRHGLTDFTMPFMVQTMRDQTNRLEVLESAAKAKAKAKNELKKLEGEQDRGLLEEQTYYHQMAMMTGLASGINPMATGMMMPMITGTIVPQWQQPQDPSMGQVFYSQQH